MSRSSGHIDIKDNNSPPIAQRNRFTVIISRIINESILSATSLSGALSSSSSTRSGRHSTDNRHTPGCFFKEASTIPFLRLPIATVFPKLQNMAYPFLHHRRKRMICDLDICLFMWHYFNNSAAKIYKRKTQAK